MDPKHGTENSLTIDPLQNMKSALTLGIKKSLPFEEGPHQQ